MLRFLKMFCWLMSLILFPAAAFSQGLNLVCDGCFIPDTPVNCTTKTVLSTAQCHADPQRFCVLQVVEGVETPVCPVPFQEDWVTDHYLGTMKSASLFDLGNDCKKKEQKSCVVQFKCVCEFREINGVLTSVCVASQDVFGYRSFEQWVPHGVNCYGQ